MWDLRTIASSTANAILGAFRVRRKATPAPAVLANAGDLFKRRVESAEAMTSDTLVYLYRGALSREAGLPPAAARWTTAQNPGAGPEPPVTSERCPSVRRGSRLHRRSESASAARVDDGPARRSWHPNPLRHGPNQ